MLGGRKKWKRKRVKYLCPYCSTKFDAFEDLKTHVLSAHAGEPAPSPEGIIRLTINGDEYRIQVQPEWTLNYPDPRQAGAYLPQDVL